MFVFMLFEFKFIFTKANLILSIPSNVQSSAWINLSFYFLKKSPQKKLFWREQCYIVWSIISISINLNIWNDTLVGLGLWFPQLWWWGSFNLSFCSPNNRRLLEQTPFFNNTQHWNLFTLICQLSKPFIWKIVGKCALTFLICLLPAPKAKPLLMHLLQTNKQLLPAYLSLYLKSSHLK